MSLRRAMSEAPHTHGHILKNLPLERQLDDFGEEPKSLIT